MITPYITPRMLLNSPMGIDWTSIGASITTPLTNLAALYDICLVSTADADRVCVLPLRATSEVETLNGPDFRVTISNSTGVAQCLMSHWPVISVLGAQWAPRAQFPKSFTKIPKTMMQVFEPMANFLGGSQLGISGGDGMNQITIAPGYVTWWTGRNGCTVEIAYQNGWPHAGIMPNGETSCITSNRSQVITVGSNTGLSVGLPVSDLLGAIPPGTTITATTGTIITLSATCTSTQSNDTLYIGYPAGVTELIVDDVTAFVGTMPSIYDGPWQEQVIVTSITAYNPIPLLPTVEVTAGPGIVTLRNPTRFPHLASLPAQSILTTLPDEVRMACYFFAASEALTRGATAITAQALPGSSQKTAGPTLAPGSLTLQGERRLTNFRRVV